MTNSSQLDEIRPIAGEPANDSPIKPIPPLDGSIHVEQDESDEKNHKRRKIMLTLQTISIIVALILSAYSFTIIESLDDTTSKSGNDATEVLVRTEGREADHICTEGGFDTGHCLWSFDVTTLQVELVYDPWVGIGNNSDAVNYGRLVGNNELVMFVADNGISGHELHLWSPLTLNEEWLIW